ncbi:lipid-A-disaccharide synthase N-terminal domain-containing protein [Rhizorhapis suberifaciens]|uniref:Lipid-A-disaccharide synthase-like uncharacterized protein n=1 Tax=Rhizorhapis suberifaciens TaxID=13656 RepID=A0A840HUW1_9SPHN|nr:lipid-A-disaccharide synthase N-terminal domain-containing protein [Rhizorhapis suberifaciens]MBB4641254.1 lipid-A-disaccharide synthase-like uncharacterized protein [Rhizorhapis suberifaciens]
MASTKVGGYSRKGRRLIDILAFFKVETTTELWWVALGLGAQVVFGMRFIVQWLHSERAGRSVVPVAFWHLSLVGGAAMTAYAIYREDPVFIIGQGLGLAVYVRNLWMIYRERKAQRAA